MGSNFEKPKVLILYVMYVNDSYHSEKAKNKTTSTLPPEINKNKTKENNREYFV